MFVTGASHVMGKKALRATFKSQLTLNYLVLPGSLKCMLESLTLVEKEVYELVLRAGELMAKDIPLKKAGVVPSLVRKGLLEVYKKHASPTSPKKLKYLRLKKTDEP